VTSQLQLISIIIIIIIIIICLPITDITPHVAQMMRHNPTDPDWFSAIEGDTKIPDPVNRTQVQCFGKI